MKSLLFDSHAHINLSHYDEDREKLIENIFNSGLEHIVIPGIDYETIYSALDLSKKYKNKIFCAIGFHPTDIHKWEIDTYKKLKKIYFENKDYIVAIGETGLDYYWDKTPKDLQKEIFIEHIKLASELDLPLIIHTRDSLDDTLNIIENNKFKNTRGVFHCFSGDKDFALKCIKNNFYISFAGNITFKSANNLRDVAKYINLENILIETDSPFLTPVPFRGKRNDPSKVFYVAKTISDIKNIDIEEVIQVTNKNAKNLFSISKFI
ncbi:MAG: putative metal-dependent hydrolase YabD [Candidatus Sericytochromatia bacterium]|nr:MAG: putative metal-dependent hydrolase YabD [Candidatus Sericytochromatia bacterium]